jgi:epoxide hydrolase
MRLLLTHGWPGCFTELSNMIEPLTDPVAHGGSPDDAFHVVCLSRPGFGSSDNPPQIGCGPQAQAGMWRR